MNFILDTHVFLWQLVDPEKISNEAMGCLKDPDSKLWVSAASLWEIGILMSLKRIRSKLKVSEMASQAQEDAGISTLPIEWSHVDRLRELPFHHRDPFDRLLIAQAVDFRATILSKDKLFDVYNVKRVW